jgi:cytochrome o ubiquinol oxidase subunit 3
MATAVPIENSEVEFTYSKTVLGFWVYLMTDCVLFATLFATYAVLHTQTFGGPSGQELFKPPLTLAQTMALLTSSFTSGLATVMASRGAKNKTLLLFGITFLLGAAFLGMELYEFSEFVHNGDSWERSAFLSSFFTLVGTHGAHITVGLIWMMFVMIQIGRRGLTPDTVRRQMCLSLFWHFLDVVWIFLFTIVYLMGVVGI